MSKIKPKINSPAEVLGWSIGVEDQNEESYRQLKSINTTIVDSRICGKSITQPIICASSIIENEYLCMVCIRNGTNDKDFILQISNEEIIITFKTLNAF